jgi:membrane protease YdiL (CAAX protease family)
MKTTLLTVALVGLGLGLAFRESVAGTTAMWLWLGVPYVALAAFALRRFYDDGTLRDVLQPRSGDLTIGFLVAGCLYGGAWAVHHFAVRAGSPQLLWLYRLALSLGSARPSPLLFGLVALFALLEEIVWRGLVLSALADSLGARRAWPAAAVAYALAHVPTVVVLGDRVAGPNPVLVLAAFGCGLVWSFAVSLTGRLPPVMVSHAIFSYFAIATLLPRFG